MKANLLKRVSRMAYFGMCGLLLSVPGNLAFARQVQVQVQRDSEVYLNVPLNNVRLEEVLHAISEQTRFTFAYNRETVDINKIVSIDSGHIPLELLLKRLSEDADLQFLTVNSHIYVRDREYPDGPEAGPAGSLLPEPPAVEAIIAIGGTVTDPGGTPLPGVNVTVKGGSQGTATDADGRFLIEVKDESVVLVFSFMGYISREVPVRDQTTLRIVLDPDVMSLDEVVVIGYGEQKKVNVTGAVSTVSADELIKRPAANVQNLLQGKVTGLQVVQNSGQPGDDGATMVIRGLGTFSEVGNSPLVLVDGVVGDMSNLNADNIESISILKDAASASIYGARAANGVILITTKKGKAGALSIDYRADFQLHQPTRMPKLVTNSADYMEYFNTARLRSSQAILFSEEEIDAYRNAADRVKYPNFDWMNLMLKNAFAQNHYLSASGGSEKTTYNIAFGYLDQDGVVGGHGYQRYNFNVNIDSRVKEIVTIGANLGLTKKDIREPTYTDENFMLMVYSRNPLTSPYLPDGSGRFAGSYNQAVYSNRNPLAVLESGGTDFDKYSIVAQSYIDISITKDLTWGIKGAINFNDDFSKLHDHPVNVYFFSNGEYQNNLVSSQPGVRDNFNQSLLTTLYSTLRYNKHIGTDHSISVLAGYNQENFRNRFLQGSRTSFPADELTELNAGSLNGQSNEGTSYEWAIQSFFGRLNYDYKEKYLFEANFRYDGTSRIQRNNRWGIFPSVSAGWRLSNEEALRELSWMDNLKLRASWGRLGNQNIGNYPYQDILSVTTYPFQALEQGALQNRLTDKNLRWETTTITDVGMDFSLKNGLLAGSLDWYSKVTNDILYEIEVPMSVGLTGPTVNFAKMQNRGFELELSHSNYIGELRYSVNANFSTNRNKVLKINAPYYDANNTIQEGLPWMSNYMIEWTGIFQSEEEIANSPVQPYNPKPGDLKFKDQNNDGKIDGDDRVVVDGAYPDFYYAGGINLSWKRFDLSAFFQGLQGSKFFVDRWGTVPFTQGTAPTIEFAKNAWTPENKSNTHPAMYQDGYGPVTGTRSTYFLENASYLRLKNLVIGYTLPEKTTQTFRMKSLRFYLSGDNLITFTKYPGADPERLGIGRQRFATYPQLKIFTAGLTVKF